MAEQPPPPPPSYPPVWKRLPNTSFGIGMGLAGQAVLWNAIDVTDLMGESTLPGIVGFVFWMTSLVVSIILLIFYGGKAVFYYPLVQDELKDGARIHFFNMPHLILIMLNTGLPQKLVGGDETIIARLSLYAVALAAQLVSTSYIYEMWLFSEKNNLSCAKPQFLLSTVGWFLLAALGGALNIEEKWGIALPTFCLTIGLMFYLMVVITIFNSIHGNPKAKGNPALFLLIAPPSVGVVAFDIIENDPESFAMGAGMLLGWCLGIVLLLFRVGPQIMNRPPVLGAYWAYVFPLAGLATACTRYASVVGTPTARVLAFAWIIVSLLAVIIVFARMCYHFCLVASGRGVWGDPLFSKERLAVFGSNNYAELEHDAETA